MQNPENVYEAFCIDFKGKDALFLIPALDMQTMLNNTNDFQLNQKVALKMSKVDITIQNVIFSIV